MADNELDLTKEDKVLAENKARLEASRLASATGAAERVNVVEQQGFFTNLGEGFKTTALYKLGRYVTDNVGGRYVSTKLQGIGVSAENADYYAKKTMETLGYSKEESEYMVAGSAITAPANYDKTVEGKKLIDGIPVEYWDDILAYDNLEYATMARNRITEQLERSQRIAGQKSGTSTLAIIAGGFLDIDVPLAMLSGGTFTGLKVARNAYKASRVVGLRSGTAIRLASALDTGVETAVVSGALTATSAAVDPTTSWSDVALSVLGGGTVGAGLGAFLTGATRRAVERARTNLADIKITRPAEEIDTDVMRRANEGALDPDQTFMGTTAEIVDDLPEDVPGPAGPSTVGAARVPVTGPIQSHLSDVSPVDQAIIRNSSDWLDRSGARDAIVTETDSLWGGIMSGAWIDPAPVSGFGRVVNATKSAITRAVNVTGNDVMGLVRSKSNVANTLFMQVFENPAGFARGIVPSTAATLKAAYEPQIASSMLRFRSVLDRWAKDNGHTMTLAGKRTGVSVTNEGRDAFNRMIYENLNDMRMGRAPRNTDPHVMEAMAMVQDHGRRALDVAKGHDPRYSIKGMENLDYDDAYFPQRVAGERLFQLVNSGTAKREAVEDAFSRGYQSAGMPKDQADIVAKAVVARGMAKDMDLDTNLIDMMNEDGREFLRQRLTAMGHDPKEIDLIISKLTGIAEERGRAGFTKHRNDLDLDIDVQTTNGQRVRLVDLMEGDIEDVLHRYRRGLAGAAAMARKGIRSSKELDVMLGAMQTEMQALGEEAIPMDKLQAMFSEFRAGPGFGYALGHINKGVDPLVSIGKDAANLSLLHSLGFAQLAETGAMMATAGFSQWRKQTRAILGFEKEIADTQSNVRQDLAPLMGEIGKDHHLFRPHRNLDEVDNLASKAWLRTTRRALENMSFIQSYTSLFNTVRAKQQELSASILSNKILREIKNNPTGSKRLTEDLGISEEMFDNLKALIDNGTIEFREIGGIEYVNRLNPDQWNHPTLGWDFGSVMMRGQSRLVQKGLIGEQDTFYRTNVGAILSHLKMFPLTALPKQFMRNAKYMDAEAMGVVMYGMATAYLSLTMRDVVTGNNRSEEERIRAAITYSSALGWVPMTVDPVMTMIGMDDMRISKYGRHYESTIPMMDVANRLLRVPGAAVSALTGDMSGSDKQALLALPWMRTLGIGEWLLPG